HRTDLVPVRQHMVHPVTGKVVPPEQIRRGYDLGDGRFLLLDDEELASLEPPPSREIEIARFVEAPGVDREWYDRPYHLAPDGDRSGYAALAAALHQARAQGIAAWVMRKKAYR
ncbi:MAG TPA: Ku protein, partial [Longimicrobiales bacterium]|nr:Ku protein [Longimicrobiales bacterium]